MEAQATARLRENEGRAVQIEDDDKLSSPVTAFARNGQLSVASTLQAILVASRKL